MKSGYKSDGWVKEGIGEEGMESSLDQGTLYAYMKFSSGKTILKTCALTFFAELFIEVQK